MGSPHIIYQVNPVTVCCCKVLSMMIYLCISSVSWTLSKMEIGVHTGQEAVQKVADTIDSKRIHRNQHMEATAQQYKQMETQRLMLSVYLFVKLLHI